MSIKDAITSLRDGWDVLRHARSPGGVVRAMMHPSRIQRRVLNGGHGAPGPGSPAEVAAALRRIAGALKAEAMSDDGASVDYARLGTSAAFEDLQRTSAALRSLDPAALPGDAQRLAFWINLYNVLVIHGIIVMGIRRSVMEEPAFFSTVAYSIGGQTYTPDDIEHGILRRNAPHPATGHAMFSADDPRLAAMVGVVDPRIHFALVCAARSCPPIAFYDPEAIDRQLELAAESFVAADTTIDAKNKRVERSILLHHYAVDFGGVAGAGAFLLARLDGEQRLAYEGAREAGWPIHHRRYDWGLNHPPHAALFSGRLG